MSDLLLQALYSGLLAGGSYALIALGLSLVFGTMKIVNLAHGELVLLGAYSAYVVESRLGVSPLLAIPAALLVTCAAAAIVYLLVARIRADRELNSLILTYGVGIALTHGLLLLFAADVRSTQSAWLQDAVVLGPLYAMNSELAGLVMSLALIGALWWWLARTWHGRAVRAVASDREAAQLMGIDPGRVELLSFLAAGVLAAVAGVALFASAVVQPALGGALTIKAFVIAVLAGAGSAPGVLAAALLLGVVESLTVTYWSPALRELAGMVLFLLVLYVLPNGLFGSARRRA